jgi:Ca2+-binding EF-hand superfamily protein
MVRTFTASALLRNNALAKKKDDRNMQIVHQQAFVKDVLNRFSSDGKVLNSTEASRWLVGLSSNGSINDDELRWILMLGNKSSESEKRFRGSMKELDLEKAVLFPDTFEFVMDSWITYIQNKPTIDGIFQKFDVDRNGSLSRDEVSNMLTMLNEGVPPNEEDMEWVIQSADEIGDGEGIETPEVLQLISAWYIRPSLQTVEEEDPEDLNDQDAGAAPRKGSKKEDNKDSPQDGGAAAQDGDKQHPAAVSPNQVCGQCHIQ